ncbi:hypothetical protein ACFQH3_09775 [Haladaptatus sp. GCM10025707]|uniref:hypothetical protein n=1 Tax=unclassified Haladaptatus TaxID=2622732 RepID=UPI0023E7625D|nr:hypothetical protein [Haladaptatus sp. QDMS2]
MAMRGSRDQFPVHRQVPFDTETAHRLSCELGEYLTTQPPAEPLATVRDDAGRAVTVYALTEHSCVVRFRTSVGHLRFFEVPRADVSTTIDQLRQRGWQPVDSGA